jgi:hypothetical protein
MDRPVRRTITVTITETWTWVWQAAPPASAEQGAQVIEYKVYQRQRSSSESLTDALRPPPAEQQ